MRWLLAYADVGGTRVSAEMFERYIIAAFQRGDVPSTAGLLRMAQQVKGNPEADRRWTDRGRRGTAFESPTTIVDAEETSQLSKCSELEVCDWFEEMSCHLALMDRLLSPLCRGDIEALSRSQREHVRRLLKELVRLQEGLKRDFSVLAERTERRRVARADNALTSFERPGGPRQP